MTESRSRTLMSWFGAKRRDARMPELGTREISVLEALWQRGSASAQDVMECMAGGAVSLSTVQSTLERLHRKGLVTRRRTGKAYLHQPALSRSQLIGRLLQDMADEFAGGDIAPMVSGFIEYAARESPELQSEFASILGKNAKDEE